MKTHKTFPFSAPARGITGLRLVSIVMLAAMLLGLLPVQPAAASEHISRSAAAQGAPKGNNLPVIPAKPAPAPSREYPSSLTLADYPPPEISKTDDPDPVAGSAPLTYTLRITNSLDSPIGGFIVTDTLPAGVIFVSAAPSQGGPCSYNSGVVLCSLGSLGAHASATILVHVITPATPATLTNLAEVVDARTEPMSTTQQTLVMPADLSITQTDSPDPALWNQPLSYALSVTNHGPYPAQNVIVVDTLPAGATFTSASVGCTHVSGVVTCLLGTLAVDQTANLSITIQAPPGNIRNQAAVSALNPDPDPEDNLAEEWTAVQLVDLAIGKQASPAFVLAGDLLTYTLSITNQGSLIAPSVVITDRLPSEVAFISASAGCVEGGGVVTCTVGNLNPGASATATIVVTPNALPPDGPLYSLQATMGVLFILKPLDGQSSSFVRLELPGDTLILGGGLDFDPTTGILYAVILRQSDYHRWLVIIDPVTALVTPVFDTELGGHQIIDITFDDDGNLWAVTGNSGTDPNALVRVDMLTEVVTLVMNTGGSYPQTIAWNPDDGLLYNLYGNTVALQTIHPVTKVVTPVPLSATAPDLHQPGSLEYDLNARMFVMGELAHPQDFYHLFADGRIIDVGNLSHECIGLAKLTNDILNLATVSSAGVEINPADNQAGVNTTVDAPELVITKDDNPEHVELNSPLTYSLLIENISPYTATGVLVTDTLPAGVTLVSALPSQGEPCSQVGSLVTCPLGTLNPYTSANIVIVVTSPNIPGTITNRAEAVDDRIAYTIDLEDTLVEPVDLTLTKVDNSDPTEGMRPLTYTLTIQNNSIYTASGVVVTDTLPPSAAYLNAAPSQGEPCTRSGPYLVICSLGDIGPGASATIEIGVTPQNPGVMYNEATVGSTNTELIPANNTDGENTTVLFPQLAVDKIDTPDPADPSAPLTYTIYITNTSIYTALGVVLEDTLPPAMVYISASASQGGACSQVSGLVTCPLGTINPAASALVTITVITPDTPGVYTNLAEATDDRVAYAYDREETAVAPANLTIVKYDNPEPAMVGNPLTYTLVVTNYGPFEALNVVISDTLPDKVTFRSATVDQGTCDRTNGVVVCDIGTLPVLGTATAVIVVTPVDIPPPGVLLSVQKDSSYLRWLNQTNGAELYGGYITIPGVIVRSAYGLNFDPTTQYLYAILWLSNNDHHWLVRINPEDPANIIGTPIVDTQQSGHEIVDIAFDDNGTLWAVTGVFGTNPQSLVTVNTSTGEVTYILSTGCTRERQSLAYNPDDGLLYNFYTWATLEGEVIVWHYKLQTIDPVTGVIVGDIPVSGDALGIEGSLQIIGSMTYDMEKRNFILGELDHVTTESPAFVRLTTEGVATYQGRMNHAVDGLAISSPILNNYAFASALNPDPAPGDNVYREPTEPLPHPQAASVGERVWEDQNGNGIQDAGEPGLAGVSVHLYKQGWGHLNTVTTDADGNYQFKYLIPGQTYTITFDLPADYYFTQPDQGSDDALDSDADPATGISPLIVPGDSTNITDLDAGMYRLTSVGERAWHDLDLDGIQDASEPGLPGIPVSLYDSSNVLVDNTITDNSGVYSFPDINPGAYWLAFQAPSGYGFSPQNQGGPTIDSDADAYGNTASFTLFSGTPDITRDAGIASHPASDVYYNITPDPVDEGSPVELNGGYHDPDFGDIYSVVVDWGDGFSGPAVVSGVILDYVFTATHTYADGDELYEAVITIEDQFGNSSSQEINVAVLNISPILSISGAAVAEEGASYTLGLSPVNDPGADTVSTCSLDWGDGTPADDCLANIGGTIDHIFPDGPAVHTITIDLEDEDNYYAEVDWLVVNVSNVAPVGVEDLYPVNEDEVLVVPPLGVLANDLDVATDALTAALQNSPPIGSLTFHTDGSFIYTPTLEYNGSVEFTYIASDGLAWSEPTTATILVGPINDPPVVDAGSDQAGSEGSPLSFSGAYTDIDLRLSDGRTFLHINQPTIAWAFGDGEIATGTLTPTHAYGDNGIYTVTLAITDELGSVGTDTLVVTITNVAPALNSLPDLLATPLTPITITVTLTDTGWLDTHTVTVTWGDSHKNTYTLEAAVYSLDIHYTYTEIGLYPVTIEIADKDHGQDTLTFSVNVRMPKIYLPLLLK